MPSVAAATIQMTPYEVLKELSLFAGTAETTVDAFAKASQFQTVPKGTVLFLQDDESEWFYVLTAGWVKLFRETVDGNEAVIDMVTRGHIIGDTAVLEDGVHSFGAATVEETTFLRVPSSLLKATIKENHEIALAMLTSMSKLRTRQTREIESLTLQNASQRIGCFMLRLCQLSAVEPIHLTLPYDKSLIAARLGMKSETFSRALNKLRSETNITIKGANVEIPSIDILSHYVCSACSNEFPCSDLT